MVAIVSGNGLGVSLSSLSTLGNNAATGAAAQGRNGELAFVDIANGNLILQDHDAAQSALGAIPLDSLRVYNSEGTLDATDNWTNGFQMQKLALASGSLNGANSTITRTDTDGAVATYTYANGVYTTTAGGGGYDTIAYNATTLAFTRVDTATGATEHYDSSGKLVSLADAEGNTFTYAYNGAGLVTSVKDAAGVVRTYYDYDTSNRLTQIRTVSAAGVVTSLVHYVFDTANRLTSVSVDLSPADSSITDGKVYTTTYAYTSATSKQLQSVTQSDGSSLTFAYLPNDPTFRLQSVTDNLGNKTSFAYDAVNRKTTVTDANNQSTVYSYDAGGQLLSVAVPSAAGTATTSYAYNGSGDLTQVVDPSGRTILMTYDANGNQLSQMDAAGNTVTRSFDANKQLATETAWVVPDPDGVGAGQPGTPMTTRYVYDAASGHQLRFVLSPEGRVTQYVYNATNQRVATITYPTAAYAVGSLGATAVPTEAQMTSWVATLDLTQSVRADVTYDVVGNVSQTVAWAKVDAAGAGVSDGTQSTSKYVYDQYGHLLQVIKPGAGTTNFTYDGLGRVLTQQDANGTATNVYDDANNKVVATAVNGLITTSTYDKANRLVSLVRGTSTTPVIGQTTYAYDADGNLLMTTDPDGNRTFALYDAARRLVATIDATGLLTERVCNLAGQVVETIRYATAVNLSLLVDGTGKALNPALSAIRPTGTSYAAWTLYDTAGRVSKQIDAAGYVTETRYDGASRVTDVIGWANPVAIAGINAQTLAAAAAATPTADNNNDRRTRTFYDNDGNVAGTLDAEGYLAENVYDAAGRVVHTIRYAVATASANRATGTLATLRPAADNVHDIHGWNYYNDESQLVGSVDGEGYLTEYSYDLDGHLVKIVRHAAPALVAPTAITSATTLAALRPTVTTGDQVTQSVYNGLGQLTSSTNAEGTVTQYTYDTAGNLLTTVVAAGTADVRTDTRQYDARGNLLADLGGVGSAALAALGASPTAAQVATVWSTYGTSYAYDAAGLRISATDAAGNRTLYYYDVDGRATHTVNALGEVDETTYNVLGQVVATTKIGTRISTTGLTGGIDTAALLSAITAARNATLDSKVSYTYLAQGVAGTKTDELGDLTTYTYNAFGQATLASQAVGGGGANVAHKVDYDRRGLVKDTQENSVDEVTAYVYDAFGRAVTVTDPNGNLTNTTFDRLGRSTQVTGPLFVSSQATFDAFGRALTVKDANGNATTYVYDDVARTIKATDLYGVAVTRTHDREGETISILDGDGNTTTYAYDLDGRLKDAIVDPGTGHLALDTHTDYDGAGRIADTVDANNNKVTYTYDAVNRVFKRTEGANAAMNIVTTYTYDAKGQLITQQDPDNILTGITYDLAGNVLTRTVDTAGLKLKTTNTYDVRGNLVTTTDPSGVVTTYGYNAIGQRISQQVDTTLNLLTQYGYDGDGNATRVIDPDGNVTLNAYDKAGRLLYSQDGAGNVTGYTYDNDGHVLTSTRYAKVQTALVASVTANGTVNIAVTAPTLTAGQDQTTTYTYDTNGRKTLSEVDKAGLDLKTQYFYDGAGNLTKVVDPNGAATLYIYDAANRVTSALSPAGTLTQTAYDGDGHVAQTTVYAGVKAMTTTVAGNGRVTNAIAGTITPSANDVVTAYTYDAANRRKTATVDPSGLALKTSYAYDAAGNLTQVTDPAGNITYYGYDAAGRQRYVLDPQNILTETVYDGAGRVTATIVYGTAPTGLSATPNAAGLVTPTFTVVGSATLDRVTRYGYDAAGRQVYAVDALGDVTETAYDAAGLVTGVRRYTTRIALPAAGAADGRTLAMTTAAIKAAIVTNSGDISTRYAYDAAGRKVFSVDPYGSVTGYTYDAFDRLAIQRAYATTVTQPAWGTAFTAAAITTALGAANPSDRLTRYGYDNAGRTLYSVDALGVVTASVYDADSRVIKTQVYHGAITLPTDGSALTGTAIAAKLAATAGTDVVTRYAYDADGHQVYAVNAMGFVTATTYDAQGRVRAKTVYATAATLPATPGAPMSVADITAALHPNAATDQVTRYVVDDAGNVTWTIDPLGHVVANAYDKAGNVTQKKEYSAAINISALALIVGPADFSVTANAATDRVTRYFYDGDNRLRFEVDALNFVTETAYQADRTVTTQYATAIASPSAAAVTADVAAACVAIASGANDHKTTVVQDKDGRATDTTTPDGVLARDVYDAFGRVVSHTDALGLPEQITTGYVYDAAGRLSSKTVGQGSSAAQTTLFSYDALGNLDKQISADGYALGYLDTAWAQAERGRLGMPATVASLTAAQRTELLARYTTKFTYDLVGRVLTTTTAYLATTAKSSSSSTKYDAFGNAVKVVDPLGNAAYFYFDKLGRVTVQVDPLLNVVLSTYAGGFFDKVDAVRRYVNKAPAGTNETVAPTPATTAQDVVTRYTYDKLGRVLTTVNASGTADQSTESVTWQTSDGNIFNKVVTNKLGGATTYVYDRDGQELSETLPVTSLNAGGSPVAVANSFTYDAFGNRTSSIEGVGLPEQRTTLYRYDAMGRVIFRIGTSYQAFMGFNADGTVKTQAVTPVDYTHYDSLGRVIETLTSANWSGTAASGGVRTLNYYDNVGNQLMSITADGAVTRNTFTTSGKTWQSFAYATTIALPATAGGTPPTPTVDAVNDRVRTFKYDVQDRLIDIDLNAVIYWEQTNPTGAIVLNLPSATPQVMAMSKTVYDLAGNAVQQIDGRGNSTYTYYDALGRKILSIDAGGYATAWDYGDVFDSPTQQIQYSTALASASYAGQPLTTAQAVTLRATLDGTTPAATSPNRVTTYTLDRQGRVHERRLKNVAFDYVAADGTRSTHTTDSVTDFTYDALGDITEQSDRVAELSDNATNVWNVTDFTYDKLGRVTNEKDPGYTDYTGAAVRPSTDTVYDGLGNTTRVTARSTDAADATSRITSSKYDANGNLVQSTDANGNVTQYLYDFNMHVGLTMALGQQSASGALLGVLDGTTKFLGVLNADNVGSTYIKYFAYDATGRQTRQTDKSTGQVTNTRYNAFGEITGKGLGNDASTGLPAYQEFSAYNVMGKVERSNTGDGVTKLYLYDLNGNATQQIQSSATDLTAVSIVTAATDTTLQHTFSIYDNNLTRTVEPDISFQKDQVTSSAAYTQQLTPLLGAISMGDSAGGSYSSGTSDSGSYAYTPIGGESGSQPLGTAGAPQLSAPYAPTVTTAAVGAPTATINQFLFPKWGFDGGGATNNGPGAITYFPLPPASSTFPGAGWTYRIYNTTTGTAGPSASAGSSLGIGHTYLSYNQALQASNDGGATWTTLGTIENYYYSGGGEWDNESSFNQTVTSLISGIPSTQVIVAYTNYGTASQASVSYSRINANTISLASAASPVTLIAYDTASGMSSATLINGMTATPLPRAQAWTTSPGVLSFGGDVVGTGGATTTLHYRQVGSGIDWASTSVNNVVPGFGATSLARGPMYEYVISSNRGDFYGQFSLDGSGNVVFPAMTMGGSAAAPGFGVLTQLSTYDPIVTMNFGSATATPSGSVSNYQLSFTFGGTTFSQTLASPSTTVSFDTNSIFNSPANRFTHLSGGYTYTILANMSDGQVQLVGQGSGTMSVGGGDFASAATPTSFQRPIAYLTLPTSGALTGTVVVGGVGIGVNSGDSRISRTTDPSGHPVLGIDLTQWQQAGGSSGVSISYNNGDAIFSGSFAVASNGAVTSNGISCQVRQQYFPISVPGATSLTQLTINGGDARGLIISNSGGTFVVNAATMADGATRSFAYTAVNSGGTVIGQGTGSFTMQANGTLSYSFDAPALKPSVMTFTPPANATWFNVSIRQHGTNDAFVPMYNAAVTGGSMLSIDVSNHRPGGSTPALYDFIYNATYTDSHGATQRASSGSGVLTVNANGSTSETNIPDHAPLQLFGPAGEHVARLVISSPSFATVSILGDWDGVNNHMVYTWDVNSLQPADGTTKAYNYTMTMQNADGSAFLNELGNPVSISGVMTLGAGSSGVQVQQYVSQLAVSAQVAHNQTFDAFGEVSAEFDDTTLQRANADAALFGGTVDTSAVQTTFVYNTEGKLIQKTDPQTNVTSANGFRQRARPVTTYGYDLEGRLVTTLDANGNLSRENYAGAGDRVSQQWAADGGRKEVDYDIFGFERKDTDELGVVTTKTVDKMGNLVEADILGVARVANDPGANKVNATVTDLYVVDAFGQRIKHTNAMLGVDKTYYDGLGRVVKTVTAAGRTTTYSYAFVPFAQNPGITGNGQASIGGYQLVTGNPDGTTTTDNINYFGVTTWHVDEGGHTFMYIYDVAGHLTQQTSSAGQNIYYKYYANGDLQEERDVVMNTMTRYGYDNAGNRVWEQYSGLDATKTNPQNVYQSSTLVYDELDRLIRVQDVATDIQYQFDAVGNRRAVHAIYWDQLAGLRQVDDLWYTYDAVNRFTMTKGSLSGHATTANDSSAYIVQGAQGVKITYDLRGERKTALNADGSLETYNYSADGFLEDTLINGVLRARRRVDALGRSFEYLEYTATSTLQTDQTSTYDGDSRLQASADMVNNSTTKYFYFLDKTNNQATATQTGAGALAHVDLKPSSGSGTSTIYTYDYWESARQTTIKTQVVGQSAAWATGLSQLSYDVNGYLIQARDNASGRTLTYTNSAHGLVIKRVDQTPGQKEVDDYWYYANDHVVGDVSTSATENATRTSYAEQLAITEANGKEAKDSHKKNAPATPTSDNVDFDENY
ncbi:MAG: hypothetical protein JF586_01100, partial [Burkholderiales bacterium]|nr:hypothetical protein [Burkholderiales bacterium]